MSGDLTMLHFLAVVRDHRISTLEVLLAEGFHPKVIYAKAEKAARKGYTDYGVVADRPWLTPLGSTFLSAAPNPAPLHDQEAE